MTVTERLMGLGQWSLRLRPETPRSVLDLVDVENFDKAFQHIHITPTRLGVTIGHDAAAALALYTGVLRNQDDPYHLTGPGCAFWLGDEDGKSDRREIALTKAGGTFVQWVTDIRPASLAAGTYHAIAGTLDWTTIFQSRREELDYVCAHFGGEWKIVVDTGGPKLHAGETDDLFVTTPVATILPHGGGRDTSTIGLRATEVSIPRDLEDYTTRVLVIGSDPAFSDGVTGAATPYKDYFAQAVELVRLVENANVTSLTNATALAASMVARFTPVRHAITVSTDDYALTDHVAVGDYVNLFDPDKRWYDLTNPVPYRGRTLYPLVTRLVGATWPVRRGMGVYMRDTSSGSAVLRDLTDWVRWEDGASRLELDATPRGVTGDGGPRTI